MAPPISRPQIVTQSFEDIDVAIIIYRDQERDNRVSVAISSDIKTDEWQFSDLTEMGV